MSRTLIFGGTFNPVHVGHLHAAEGVAGALSFNRVDFTPSFSPLHKPGAALLPFEIRVELLQAAVQGHTGFRVNEIEKKLPVPSVTVQTLEALARDEPDVERYFLLGDREFLKLHKWRRGADVAALTNIVIVCRTEFDIDAFGAAVTEAWPRSRRIDPPAPALMAFELVPQRRALLLRLPRVEVSSSLVRRRWLEGRSVAGLVPDAVLELMERHRPELTAVWSAGNESLAKLEGGSR